MAVHDFVIVRPSDGDVAVDFTEDIEAFEDFILDILRARKRSFRVDAQLVGDDLAERRGNLTIRSFEFEIFELSTNDGFQVLAQETELKNMIRIVVTDKVRFSEVID